MEWLVNGFKKLGTWFLGKADQLDKLDDKVKEAVTFQVRRAFVIGAAVGAAATFFLVR